jgi:predicted nucleic-acid-binding Zn-ribbon protein
MWICTACGADVQEDWEICWQCSRERDTTNPSLPHAVPVQMAHPFAMGTCPRCGGHKVIPNGWLRMSNGAGLISIAVPADPHALFFQKTISSPLQTWICGDCGYTESYATDPETLWQAYQQAQAADDSTEITPSTSTDHS